MDENGVDDVQSQARRDLKRGEEIARADLENISE